MALYMYWLCNTGTCSSLSDSRKFSYKLEPIFVTQVLVDNTTFEDKYMNSKNLQIFMKLIFAQFFFYKFTATQPKNIKIEKIRQEKERKSINKSCSFLV